MQGAAVYTREPSLNKTRVLDFKVQAEQLLALLESRINTGHRDAAIDYLEFKFKSLYEQGVISGRRYETEGEYPY